MIKFVSGDFFDYDADIRINTVNCVGVMGAGVALIFKKKFPDMFDDYYKACKKNEVQPGHPHVWKDVTLLSECTIINFPTKIHWKNPSQYEYIEKGLIWLRDYLSNITDSTVTLPALGCGHGGLEWEKVKVMITNYLKDLNVTILVFEPSSSTKKPISDSNKFDLKNHNISINGHTTKQFKTSEVTESTLVLTMTYKQKLKLMLDYGIENNIYSIKEYVGEFGDVVDPYGGTLLDYEECFEELALLVKKTMYQLMKEV